MMQRYELETWLGPALSELTPDQVDLVESEAGEIDRRFPDPDDEANRTAALSAAVQYLLGEITLPDAGAALLSARGHAAVELAATQQIARMAALDGLPETETARQAGLDRMTIRKVLGKR